MEGRKGRGVQQHTFSIIVYVYVYSVEELRQTVRVGVEGEDGHIVLPAAGRRIPSMQFNGFQMWPDPTVVYAMPTT